LLLAFSTASSSATLPVSMDAATEPPRCSRTRSRASCSSGATINKNGSAIYKAVTAIFLARLYGCVRPGAMLAIVAGVDRGGVRRRRRAGSSLVTTLIVLDAIGLGSQRRRRHRARRRGGSALDMCRSLVNTMAISSGASWIAQSQRIATRASKRSQRRSCNLPPRHLLRAEAAETDTTRRGVVSRCYFR